MHWFASLSFILMMSCSSNARKEELKIEVEHLPEFCESKAKSGDQVVIHYTGKLENGQMFDSSRTSGRQPITLVLGTQQVIAGWERGIEGMCVGEKRHLTIPPLLAYGQAGRPPVIPANAWLYFDIELIGIESDTTKSVVDVQWIWQAAQFWSIPVIVLFFCYKLYQRYQVDANSKRSKASRQPGGKKAKRR